MNRTVDYIDGRVVIIDQNKLPHSFETIELPDYRAVAEAISSMKVRGAPALGVTAALGVALGAQSVQADSLHAFLTELEGIAKEIKATRPTAVNLFWGVDRVVAAARASSDKSIEEIKTELLTLAISMLDEDEDACRKLGKFGAGLIPDGATVLTHCNAGALACVGYGTALGVIRAAAEMGKNIRVFADETRPRLQGMKLTAWELARDGIDVTIIADNMAASLMRRGEISCVVVGADRIASNGDSANKIGTYSLAVVSRAHNVPFYVAAPMSTVDTSIKSGDEIPIEERSADEMTHINGQAVAPEGVPVKNPSFDVTPAEYITAIITERGVLRPPFADLAQAALSDLGGTPR